MVAVSTVSPAETMNWQNQKSAARSSLLQNKAQGLYQQQLGQMGYAQQQGDLNRRFDQARIGVPSNFINRGTLNSGLYRKALERYALERMGATNQLQLGHQAQQGGLVLGDRGHEDNYAAILQRILGEQYSRQAQAAASGVGGFF